MKIKAFVTQLCIELSSAAVQADKKVALSFPASNMRPC